MKHGQQGSSLVAVLLAAAVLALAFGSAALLLERANQAQSQSKLAYGANALAMAGLEDARARLQLNQDADLATPSWSYTAGQAGSYKVTITRPSAALRQVTSTGTAASQSVTVTKTYDMAPPPAFRAPLFANADLDLRGATVLNGSIRTNGTLQVGQNTALGPGVTLEAGGDVLMGSGSCVLNGCIPWSPAITAPRPSEAAVREGAYEIVLTAANTDRGVFYIGGSSKRTQDGLALDSSDSNPWDFDQQPTTYIRSGDGRAYTVVIDNLVYTGRGTIATASSGITVVFGGEATVRRAQPVQQGSSAAILPFGESVVTVANNAVLEGFLIARNIELGNNPTINGVVAADRFANSGRVANMDLSSEPDIIRNAPDSVFTYAAP